MILRLLDQAESDLVEGFHFYESQQAGLGSYPRGGSEAIGAMMKLREVHLLAEAVDDLAQGRSFSPRSRL